MRQYFWECFNLKLKIFLSLAAYICGELPRFILLQRGMKKIQTAISEKVRSRNIGVSL